LIIQDIKSTVEVLSAGIFVFKPVPFTWHLQDLQAIHVLVTQINSFIARSHKTTAATKEIFSFHCLRFIN
jgi:hypothetical protein